MKIPALFFFLAHLLGSVACAAEPTAVSTTVPTLTAVAPTTLPTIPPTTTAAASPTAAPPTAIPTPTPFAPPDIHYLQAAVDAALADFSGLSSYVIIDLSNGEQISHDPNLAIAGSSLIKIGLLVQIFRALDRPPDIEQTKLLTQTTTVSSNFAANLLLRDVVGGGDIFAGADRLTQAMRELGLYNTFIAVPYDMEPPDGRMPTYLTPANQRTDRTTYPDPYRQTTIGDLAALAHLIYDCAQHDAGLLRDAYGAQLTQTECQDLLDLLKENNLARLLERGLPDGVVMAHKVGWIDDTHGNIGIVYGPEQDYLIALALYAPGWLEWDISAPIFAQISRLAYAHFNDPDAYPVDILAAPPAIPPTPTPLPPPDYPQAIVFGTRGVGLTLRATPGGAEIAILPEGTVVSLLPTPAQTEGGLTWRRIRTPAGDEGWVGELFLTFD
ncbi:MAG: serine hydrolase [Chloroflexi bacterium]|nr:serine hydrolase [Chloroflexota bacterium]